MSKIKSNNLLACDKCNRLCSSCKTNCMVGFGNKKAEIMLVGEAPGENEDEQGKPFIGRAGTYLRRRILNVAGILDDEVYITNMVRCRPPANKKPSIAEVKNCRVHLEEEVKKIKPRVIVLLGNVPLNGVLNLYRKKTEEDEKKSGGMSGITKWRGKLIWSDEFQCWIVPTYHPSFLMRTDGMYYNNQTIEDIKTAVYATTKKKPVNYLPKFEIVDSFKRAMEVLQEAREYGQFAIDTETTGLNVYEDKIVGISIAYNSDKGVYLDWTILKGYPLVVEYLSIMLTDKACTKILHNGSFDHKMFINNGISFAGRYEDTMLAAHLLDENFSKGLKELTWVHLKFGGYTEALDKAFTESKCKFHELPIEILGKYAAYDAVATFQLYAIFKKRMEDEKLTKLYNQIVMPVRSVLDNMELEGATWDVDRAKKLNNLLDKYIEILECKIHSVAGEVFNIKSNKQLARILFEKLKMKSDRLTKGGSYSTDAETLKYLLSTTKNKDGKQIIEYLLDISYLLTQQKTFVKGLLDTVNAEGKLHGQYHSAGTVTGRLSCSNPNLQNIPRDSLVRGLFIPKKGHKLICADIKAAELRVLAVVAQEKGLTDIFNSGRDPHVETYKLMFNKKDDYKPTGDERAISKRIGFGLAYGMGIGRLAEAIHVDVETAAQYLAAYFKTYPNIKKAFKENALFAKKHGYVKSIFNRRRRLPDILCDDPTIAKRAERQAGNTIIQGPAADYTYIGLIRTANEFKKRKMKAVLVNTVHDCIIADAPDEEVEETIKVMKEQFEKPISVLPIKMEVDIHAMKRWGEGEESRIQKIIQKIKKGE